MVNQYKSHLLQPSGNLVYKPIPEIALSPRLVIPLAMSVKMSSEYRAPIPLVSISPWQLWNTRTSLYSVFPAKTANHQISANDTTRKTSVPKTSQLRTEDQVPVSMQRDLVRTDIDKPFGSEIPNRITKVSMVHCKSRTLNTARPKGTKRRTCPIASGLNLLPTSLASPTIDFTRSVSMRPSMMT